MVLGWFLGGFGVVLGGYGWLGLVMSDGWLSVVMGGAKVVGVEAVDGEAGAGVVDYAIAAGERSTVVGATVKISSSIFSNLGA